ncbi:hypothetical protein PanWU01x14_360980 [Parasponia andersonii]|uniref:Uncharacterized protein n=1 Tax=Parasponia andersonii TaxID=3476 RepID=A0A2P5A7G1_PARAD|nr:hypothetical protein PanWU01x14_360980 [Parasponia andersonii]
MDVEYFSGKEYYFDKYYSSDEDENYSGYEYYFDEYHYHSIEDDEDENCSAITPAPRMMNPLMLIGIVLP